MISPTTLDVHVGSRPPGHWDDVEARQAAFDSDQLADSFKEQRRPLFASGAIDWARHGLHPKWVGDDAAACAAAIDPSPYSRSGAEEYERFLAGAERRGDVAIVLGVLRKASERSRRRPFPESAGVSVIKSYTNVGGALLGSGVRLRLGDGLTGADKDLAVRFIQNHDDGPLWALELYGTSTSSSWAYNEVHDPEGSLIPLVVDDLGEPVVAVWVSPDMSQRLYVLPEGMPVDPLLDWLANRAIPEFAPVAHRATRSPDTLRSLFSTVREASSVQELEDFEREANVERSRLLSAVEQSHAAADGDRYELLFGTGRPLVEAVARVLRSAGMEVVDVDELLGRTANADLLATLNGRRTLIEVKSGNGPASERYYTDLLTHLREWPSTGQPPIHGGALIVNHQIRTPPEDRDQAPFTRPEFVQSQAHPVISTRELLDLWRREAWSDIRTGIAGRETDESRHSGRTGPAGRNRFGSKRRRG